MRLAALLTLAVLPALFAGCGRSDRAEGAPAEPAKQAKPAEVEELWEVVKIELPGAAGAKSEFMIGVDVRVKGKILTLTQSGVFDHSSHVVAYGIDCRYCHKLDEPATAANAKGQTCWNCHQNLAVTHDGVKVTPETFARVAAQERKTLRFAITLDESTTPTQMDLVECHENGRPDVTGLKYRAIYKDDGNTRVVALGVTEAGPRPKEFKPTLLRMGLGSVVVFHLKKKS